MNRFLFICSFNKHRSTTAEHVARTLGHLADSAGIESCSVRPLTGEAIDRAELLVCMDERHVSHVRRLRPDRSADVRVWNIADRYHYGQPALIRLLKKRLRESEALEPPSIADPATCAPSVDHPQREVLEILPDAVAIAGTVPAAA